MPALWVHPEELDEASGSPYAYEACQTASYVLWAFSGRKYHGTRTITERYECPCRDESISNIYPTMDGDGQVYNRLGSDNPSTSCGCGTSAEGQHVRLRLRGTPVRHVAKVTKGGVELDPSTYRIVNSSLLEMTGEIDVCGIEITYTFGVPAPTAGKRAARTLARELTKGWAGDEECQLPDRVTNVSRQGISFTVMDPQDFLDDGRTGIYDVDLFLRAANPDKARKPARVFSPDLPKAIRQTAPREALPAGPYDVHVVRGNTAIWTVDLPSIEGTILADPAWMIYGQISSASGVTLVELDDTRFTITDGTLSVALSEADTTAVPGSGALWHLYGINASDGYTLVHVLTSTIQVS